MEKSTLKIIYLIFVLILYATWGFCQTPSSKSIEEIAAEINQVDHLLFNAVFEDCQTELLKDMLSEDLEFYHDKWGVIATSAKDFIEGARENCKAQLEGRANKSRRVLLEDSVEFYPMKNFGAIQSGIHEFYQLIDGSYRKIETARFTHLWHFDNSKWKVKRVLSYDHKDVSAD